SPAASLPTGKRVVMRLHSLLIALVVCAAVAGCSGTSSDSSGLDESRIPMTIQVTSSVFNEGEAIPVRYSCDGENISPPLTWDNLPSGTQSLALIMDDPDAPSGVFVHWVAFNIPANVSGLPPELPPRDNVSGGIVEGTNSFGRRGYGGPCP